MGDFLLDACFLLSGIAGTVFVLMSRKRFDMWISLPTCMAWIIKCIRYLYYDWLIAAVNHAKAEDVFLFMRDGHLILAGMDALINCLLFAALVRLVIVGLYVRWYQKALESQNK